MTLKLYKNDKKILEYLQIEDPILALETYPYRYDFNELKKFSDWTLNEKVFFRGVLINQPRIVFLGNKRSLAHFELKYGEQILKCTIFNRPWIRNLKPKTELNVWGKYKGNYKVTVNNYSQEDLNKVIGIKPVYALTNDITIKAYRRSMNKFYQYYQDQIENFIPNYLMERYRFVDKKDALRMIHFPKNQQEIQTAVRTLKYEEFLRFQIANLLKKESLLTSLGSAKKSFDMNLIEELIVELPFKLTNDQRTAIDEILNDLNSDDLMVRMLQGEVGSGKTLVAALAMYATYLSNMQSAFMAPTEILAIQQAESLKKLFEPKGVKVVCLYSSLPASVKRQYHEQIQQGEVDFIVGTHSLIQEELEFANLGLGIVDEQHRFGVQQRMDLKNKGKHVDQLFMSATPIPRTMASILFSDMDISTIQELPAERIPIKTFLLQENSMKPFIEDLIKLMLQGQQCYIVCPAIEENEDYPMTNVETIYHSMVEFLNNRLQLNLKVGLLHGRMSSEEKEEVMKNFANNKIQMLVTTTVIEVGIDVENANAMVIYDADRFGLSQLHQLRGRVGRGDQQGFCYLLTASQDPDTINRLKVIEKNNDGFKISLEDLSIRGPGEFLGLKQSGDGHFVLGDIIKDQVMLEYAKIDAIEILAQRDEVENQKVVEKVFDFIKKEQIVFAS